MASPAPHWKRIIGMHVTETGDIACVWLAYDDEAGALRLYDQHVYRHASLADLEHSLSEKGEWIPIAWHKGAEDMAAHLKKRKFRVLREPVKLRREFMAARVHQMMKSAMFTLPRHLGKSDWAQEYNGYYQDDGKIPDNEDDFPLMAATRYAAECVKQGKAKSKRKKTTKNYPEIAII